jgi:tetratricopeptide (TPR) repeat protein
MKRFLPILMLLAYSLCWAQKNDKYDAWVDSMTRSGKHDAVIQFFEKELKKSPNDEQVLRWLGWTHLEKRNLPQAEIYYNKAIKVNPKCARCYFNLGRAKLYSEKPEEALLNFNKAIELDPADGNYFYFRAGVYDMKANKISAQKDYDKAVELAPENADFLIGRGSFSLKDGFPSLAVADFNKAIRLAPNYYYCYLQRAEYYYNKHLFKEAKSDLEKAIQCDSTKGELYFSLGSVYGAMGEQLKAYELYSKAIAMNPKDGYAFYERALASYKMEDMDACCTDMSVAKIVFMQNDSFNEVISTINFYLENICDSSKSSYYYQRGIASFNKLNFKKAIEIYNEGLKKFPGDPFTMMFRGNAFYADGNFEGALKDHYATLQQTTKMNQELSADKRFSRNSDSLRMTQSGYVASIYLSIAQCEFALNRIDTAFNAISKAIAILPPIKDIGPEAYYNTRAYINIMLSKHSSAIADFDKAISLDDRFAGYYAGRAYAKLNIPSEQKIIKSKLNVSLSDNQFQYNFTIPFPLKVNRKTADLTGALDDCNAAIAVEPRFAYAYYLRGHIKYLLNMSDWCDDFNLAGKLGYQLENSILKNCLH